MPLEYCQFSQYCWKRKYELLYYFLNLHLAFSSSSILFNLDNTETQVQVAGFKYCSLYFHLNNQFYQEHLVSCYFHITGLHGRKCNKLSHNVVHISKLYQNIRIGTIKLKSSFHVLPQTLLTHYILSSFIKAFLHNIKLIYFKCII